MSIAPLWRLTDFSCCSSERSGRCLITDAIVTLVPCVLSQFIPAGLYSARPARPGFSHVIPAVSVRQVDHAIHSTFRRDTRRVMDSLRKASLGASILVLVL